MRRPASQWRTSTDRGQRRGNLRPVEGTGPGHHRARSDLRLPDAGRRLRTTRTRRPCRRSAWSASRAAARASRTRRSAPTGNSGARTDATDRRAAPAARRPALRSERMNKCRHDPDRAGGRRGDRGAARRNCHPELPPVRAAREPHRGDDGAAASSRPRRRSSTCRTTPMRATR